MTGKRAPRFKNGAIADRVWIAIEKTLMGGVAQAQRTDLIGRVMKATGLTKEQVSPVISDFLHTHRLLATTQSQRG